MIYAKMTFAGPPAPAGTDANGNPFPPPVRARENTVIVGAPEYPARRPNRPWTDDVIADPELALGGICPPALRGFGWWPVTDTSPALGLLETHGDAVLTIDEVNRTISAVSPIIAPSAASLTAYFDKLETVLHRQIDSAAAARRADFVTGGVGQSATYDAKAAEALAIDGGATPSETAHPFIWKEAAATGKTPAALAAEVIAKRTAWIAIGSDIEAARKSAKAAVTAAKGDQAAMTAASGVDWENV